LGDVDLSSVAHIACRSFFLRLPPLSALARVSKFVSKTNPTNHNNYTDLCVTILRVALFAFISFLSPDPARAMAATYKHFLAAPTSSALADKATLHYVTTTTSFNGPTDIIKHFNTLQKQVVKKSENVINLVEGSQAAVFEVETTLEFQISGGTYLPGLDDNFLSDRVVSLLIVR
jgi:hypothetical protein